MSVRRAPTRRASTVVLVAIAAVAVVASACTGSSAPIKRNALPANAPTAPASATRPNIVFLLTDDLSTDLLHYMPNVRQLQRTGMTFTNYTVADSRCCPSRASIFSGNYPHTTRVLSNVAGFQRFTSRGEAKRTFAPPLQARGYRTAFMGKYLNRYYASYPAPKALGDWTPPEDTYVPPGWNEWDAVGLGYKQYNYMLNHDHKVIFHGHRPADYLNSVLQTYGRRFITHSAEQKSPFFLQIASFSPHTPDTPAPRDAHRFNDVFAPHTAAFAKIPTNAPRWLADRAPFTAANMRLINVRYRMRVRAVQSVDRMVGSLEKKLAAVGQLKNTIFVFSSDNGYHDGQYRLLPGKLTAFDTDVNVPLIVAGPGIAADTTNADLVQNVDLAPTFDALAGGTPAPEMEGHNFAPLLHGQRIPWRSLALVEHSNVQASRYDPDKQTPGAGDPPTYNAIRSRTFTYVRYTTGETEYYDRVHDADELHNITASLSPARRAKLNRELDALHTCTSGAQCWQAGRASSGLPG